MARSLKWGGLRNITMETAELTFLARQHVPQVSWLTTVAEPLAVAALAADDAAVVAVKEADQPQVGRLGRPDHLVDVHPPRLPRSDRPAALAGGR